MTVEVHIVTVTPFFHRPPRLKDGVCFVSACVSYVDPSQFDAITAASYNSSIDAYIFFSTFAVGHRFCLRKCHDLI